MYISNIEIKNFRGIQSLSLNLNSDINIFIGENNSGKTAIMDAIKYTLETTSFIKIEEEDFYNSENQFLIKLKFENLTDTEKSILLEYLTYEENGDINFYLTLFADKKNRNRMNYIRKEIRAGFDANISLDLDVRERIYSTYLKPLRDAEEELSSGRYSRLSHILNNFLKDDSKSTLNEDIKKFNNTIEESQKSEKYLEIIRSHLENLIFEKEENLTSKVSLSQGREEILYKGLLEKLNLEFSSMDKQGLGYQNALYIAAELLLLNQEEDISSFLIIEEPEAHLHPQLQMKFLSYIMKMLNSEFKNKIQIFITTHSPNIASKVNPGKIILSTHKNNKIEMYSLRKEETKLNEEDYIYLQKFLDITKSNMFFAKGILMVEGPSEEILIPSIAKAIGYNLEDYGVAIVNVNGVGFSRFSDIFIRSNEDSEKIKIPISVVTDLDLHRYFCDEDSNLTSVRAKKKHDGTYKTYDLKEYRAEREKSEGNVKNFISAYRSLEIDIFHSSLKDEFLKIVEDFDYSSHDTMKESYKNIKNKTDIAYFLSKQLESKIDACLKCKECDISALNSCMLSGLPKYITEAIKYSCRKDLNEE
ncbi:MAG: AAA family ATPase [Alphaproteobacteria bacterium]|jgi:putative ATP-dependent endonuclease of OLD family|nr:AAA family ATPase [Alphaproteobacteria bacterium]